MRLKLKSHARSALTLLEVLIVIATVIVLAGFFLPLLARPHHGSRRISCLSNLKQVGLGFRMWSNDHEAKFPWLVSANKGGTLELVDRGETWRHFLAVSNELNSPKILACTSDDERAKTSDWRKFNNTNVSYFVGLNADEIKPSSILSGDRNLTANGVALKTGIALLTAQSAAGFTAKIHNGTGNIGLGDGSVRQVNSSALISQLVASEQRGSPATNRFVIP